MKAKSTIRIKVSTNARLTSLLEALKPETKRFGNRSKVEIDRDGLFVILGFAIFISVFYLGLLSLNYGEFAKKRFEVMKKKGQI